MPTITVTPHRNSYAQRTEYRVTVHGIGSTGGFRTEQAAYEAGERIANGEAPETTATGRLVAVAGAGRLMGR
jgi:hypothetical protein